MSVVLMGYVVALVLKFVLNHRYTIPYNIAVNILLILTNIPIAICLLKHLK